MLPGNGRRMWTQDVDCQYVNYVGCAPMEVSVCGAGSSRRVREVSSEAGRSGERKVRT